MNISHCVFLFLVMSLTGLPLVLPSGTIELGHDQGRPAGSVFLERGYGHAVSFSPPSIPWSIRTIRVHGSRFGNNTEALEFRVEIWGGNRSVLSSPFPYTTFKTTPAWVGIDMVDLMTTGDFSIVIYTGSTAERGILISFDSGTENQHSDIVLGRSVVTDWNQVNWKPITSTPPNKQRTSWMIRVVGSGPPAVTRALTTTSTQPPPSLPSLLSFLDSRIVQIGGGAITGASVVAGWLFKTKKRRFVSDYLRRIDSTYNLHSANREECRKHLLHMKDEALRLFEKGKIDEPQFSVIDAKLTQHLKDLG